MTSEVKIGDDYKVALTELEQLQLKELTDAGDSKP